MKRYGAALELLAATAERLEEQARTVMWVAGVDTPTKLLGIIAVAGPLIEAHGSRSRAKPAGKGH